MNPITQMLGQAFQEELPQLAAALDQAVRGGIQPAALQAFLERSTARDSLIPGMAQEYLRTIDPDYDRALMRQELPVRWEPTQNVPNCWSCTSCRTRVSGADEPEFDCPHCAEVIHQLALAFFETEPGSADEPR